MARRLFLTAIAALTLSVSSYGQIVYVSQDGEISNDGLSWDTAVAGLGTGITIAQGLGYDEVWVAAGEYLEEITLAPDVAVLGGFAGGETDVAERAPWQNVCIINANSAGQAVTGADGATLDGFTVKLGRTGPTSGGGGLANSNGSVVVRNCIFDANSAGFGGAIWNFQGDVSIVNCVFKNNDADYGAVVYNLLGTVQVLNSTLAGNEADNGGKMLYTVTGTTTVSSSIIWANNGGSVADISDGETTITDSIVKDGEGENVSSVDPLFFSQENRDYRLTPDSPAVDAGVEFVSTPNADIRGLLRVDGDGIDMGAFEMHLDDPTDTDGDGIGDTLEGTDDPDNDNIPNYLDDDSNGNDVLDELEGGDDIDGDGIPNFLDDDADGNGLDSEAEGTGDTDNDGTPDIVDEDNDGDNIPDIAEGILDRDGDGTPNLNDTDSDGDGVLDIDEGASDADMDGIPNFLDLDSDGNGISDEEEGGSDDDGDGIPNFVDDNNDVPMVMNDVNVDGSINAADIQAVINAVLGL